MKDLRWCTQVVVEHGERVVIGLDVRITDALDGTITHRLMARGSTDDVGDLWETLAALDSAGCARYVLTDVSRDGMLGGPNLELLRAVANASATPLVASGGVASLDDLVALASVDGVEGVIVGKALYEGRFTLPAARCAVNGAA